MLFNSLHFAVFFPVVSAAYFLTPYRSRWAILLAASCYFYMALIPKYILVLFALILIDYFAAIVLESCRAGLRKPVLVASLLANIGVLVVFKYFNFFAGNMTELAGALGWNLPLPVLRWALPVGLSFHTFQSMSYTIEVYRGSQRAERHLGYYALFVLFFPQLVAGPIERPQNMLHQFHERHDVDWDRMASGLRRMGAGLFKKMVIADTLSVIVGRVYAEPGAHSGIVVLFATYCFAFQIYCDFSGYSDVAIGAGRFLGFRMSKNFDHPYWAQSVGDFWRRWHISLSSWFRDYLYIPLGGNRVAPARRAFNLLIVFLVSGLWHGANWTFVAWGLVHGIFLVVGQLTSPARERFMETLLPKRFEGFVAPLRILVTFHLVCFAWIFFRAASIADAQTIIARILSPEAWGGLHLISSELGLKIVILSAGLVILLEICQRIRNHSRLWHWAFAGRPDWVRWSYYYGAALILLAAIILRGVPMKPQQFIYYQF